MPELSGSSALALTSGRVNPPLSQSTFFRQAEKRLPLALASLRSVALTARFANIL